MESALALLLESEQESEQWAQVVCCLEVSMTFSWSEAVSSMMVDGDVGVMTGGVQIWVQRTP